MIGYLKGKILLKEHESLVIENRGVGYRVLVSKTTLEKLKTDSVAELFIWTHLKRETIDLYGSSDKQEFELFRALEKMSGIGPKTALQLSGLGSLKKLKHAIENKDSYPSFFKGIGKKRLQRLFLELTGEIKKVGEEKDPVKEEALSALVSLGFSKTAGQKAILEIPSEIKETEKIIKRALKILGKNKSGSA